MRRGRAPLGMLLAAVLCSGCDDGGDPSISMLPEPPDGAVGSRYNQGDGLTCAPSGSACALCYVGGSIRACPANWRYHDNFVFTATDGLAPFFWTATSLPAGLTLQLNGSIDGTPTTAGTYAVPVTVTDSSFPAHSSTDTVTIDVVPPLPPTIATSPAASKGAIDRPYLNTFVATNGLAPLTWSEAGELPPGLAFAVDGTMSGTPSVIGAFAITLSVHDSGGQSATPQDTTIDVLEHGFASTALMSSPRTLHTATLLASGAVLVVGGFDGTTGLSSAELYDPTSATFSLSGSMAAGRFDHTATLLENSTVLVVGGLTDAAAEPDVTALLFSPSSGGFSIVGSLSVARHAHTATLLDDGTVLICGGTGSSGAPLASAELYDPATGRFTTVGTMTVARSGHTATLLASGDVLVAGGTSDTAGTTSQTAEIFNTRTRRFTATGSMFTPRAHQSATLLLTGEVLVAGGIADNAIASAETYNQATGGFTQTGDMRTAHSAPTASLLPDGTVLITGAGDDKSHLTADAELYDPTSGDFTPTGSMTTARDGHTATPLPTAQVLVIGGSNGTALASAEVYQ